MGKKSRRKGNKKGDKKAHKERQLERRERVEEHLDHEHYDDGRGDRDGGDGGDSGGNTNMRPFLVGDRVFFHDSRSDGDNPDTYRGVVKNIREDTLVPSLDILPLHAEDDKEDLQWTVPADDVFVDWWDWTVRFEVGENVLCNTADGWLPGTVAYQWPIYELESWPRDVNDDMVFYKCKLHPPTRGSVAASSDADHTIMKHPTAFRFSEGDEAIFNADKAEGVFPKRHIKQAWITGTIVRVDIVGRHDYYAVYECTFTQKGKTYTCHILKDDDEHVARANANPRDRLFEAIEQDCSTNHIDYLTSSSGMDVSTFLNLVLAKSIEFASYNALLWLQEKLSLDLYAIRDDRGSNLLHQITSSPHAIRFLRTVSRISFLREQPQSCIDLEYSGNMDDSLGMLYRKNDDGNSWLHTLILEGNVRALDCALSPRTGMAWMLSCRYNFGEENSALMDAARRCKQVSIERILKEFFSFHSSRSQEQTLRYMFRKSEDEILHDKVMSDFTGKNSTLVAKRFMRFCRDWGEYHPSMKHSIGRHLFRMAEHGFYRLFCLLVEVDHSLLCSPSDTCPTAENRDEYVQPELYDESDDYRFKKFSLVSVTLQGHLSSSPPSKDDVKDGFDLYWRALQQHGSSCACRHSWLSHIKEEKEKRSDSYIWQHSYVGILEYKIYLLEDDESLANRLRIMDYLVKVKGQPAPNPLDAVRFRQCGVLRWLVRESIVDLGAEAHTVTDLVKSAKQLQFLNSRRIPASVSVGGFLCFAAIEFDDLQSLQWLVDDMGVAIKSLTIDEWNTVHASAYFGRLEIIQWLRQQPAWASLVGQMCNRKPWEKSYAAHIAVNRGLVLATELLLSFGCPSSDNAGKSVYYYARKSSHEFVLKWGGERERPLRLESDIQKLLQLISRKNMEDIKKHILNTKCLEIETWTNCDFDDFDTPGPRGETYADTLVECCKHQECDFVLWLSNRLSWWPGDCFHRRDDFRMNKFWRQEEFFTSRDNSNVLDVERLTRFASDIGDEDVVGWLARPWARNVTCRDPLRTKPILFLLDLEEKLVMEDLSLKLWNRLLYVDILCQLICDAERELNSQLKHGASPAELQRIVEAICSAAVKLAREEDRETESYFNSWSMVTSDGFINLGDSSLFVKYEDDHPVRRQMQLSGKSNRSLSVLYRVLAIEDYADIIEWSFLHARPWDAAKEIEMVRIAAFCGHSNTLDLFLDESDKSVLLSSTNDRFEAAMLGAAEAGRLADLEGYLKICEAPADPVVTSAGEIPTDFDSREERRSLIQRSLSAAAVNGCLQGAATLGSSSVCIDDEHRQVLIFLMKRQGYKTDALLHAAELVLMDAYEVSCWERLPSLFSFLSERGLEVWQCEGYLRHINKQFIEFATITSHSEKKNLGSAFATWFGIMKDLGLDLQSLKLDSYGHREAVTNILALLKDGQLSLWAQFDVIKHGQPLLQIKEAVGSGDLQLSARDKGGLLLTHLAASYDRVDLLAWLVDVKGMDLSVVDGQGRNVLQVAAVSKASLTTRWISHRRAREVISSFVATHFRRKLELQRKRRMLDNVIKIQAMQRGNAVRKSFRGLLAMCIEESQRFQAIWNHSIDLMSEIRFGGGNWASVREQQHNIRRADHVDAPTTSETGRQLGEAISSVMTEMDDLRMDGRQMECAEEYNEAELSPTDRNEQRQEDGELSSTHPACTRIQLTNEVVKWLKHGDPKYREFFVRRMQQLAIGDRSRILAKRLKGSKSAIFETYLEQKSGHRILWRMDPNGVLLVWFVAKHKDVSRLVRLIDDSESRSTRQRVPASSLPEFQQGGFNGAPLMTDKTHIVIDPLGNVPLKLYDINLDDMQEITDNSWVPRLHLTDEERDVVEAKGTVLLLGRSGTGKTICICNRIDYDRQRMAHDPAFSQLFVARSRRLCKYVCDTVEADPCSTFSTFGELVQSLENLLQKSEDINDLFLPSRRMDFARFKREVYQGNSPGDVDASIVWTNIRTFIKGSIEAVQKPERILLMDDYIPLEKLGKKRCRLFHEQREAVYKIFLRYNKYLANLNLWDDCDRITALLQRLEQTKASDPAIYDQVRRTKIYVDEIQDYTQAEVLLFFYLSGPGDLFLAGDSAQSVVEGVEFRFEEIRSVGYYIAGPERRQLIPQKPKIVNLNFRSHSGILNTAAAILRCLFEAFPDSAKQLKEDRGLFRGPRPGVFHKVESQRLSELVSEKLNGAVILTHDAKASRWKRALGGYPLVYGIREAKGLEFKSVILLDFFTDLPLALQKPWRNLLLGRGGADFNMRYPEVEGNLKLLYTAVTRCIEQLFFAETSVSFAGDAFVRWLTTTSVRKAQGVTKDEQTEALATRNNVDDVEKMAMTRDEWLVAAIDNAEMAEGDEDLAQSEALLEKAVYCFEQARDLALASKARTHRSSVHFRSKLPQVDGTSSSSQVEVRAAELMEVLLSENLFLEGRELCRSILPYLSLYSSKQLQKYIMPKLSGSGGCS